MRLSCCESGEAGQGLRCQQREGFVYPVNRTRFGCEPLQQGASVALSVRAHIASRLRVRSGDEQRAEAVEVAPARGVDEGRPPAVGAGVDLGVCLKESNHAGEVAVLGGEVEGVPPALQTVGVGRR